MGFAGSEGKMIRVAVAGGFDYFHEGHLDHLLKAKALGDELIVITHHDELLIRKKGYCLIPLKGRVDILKQFRCVDEVVFSIDDDGTVAKTLECIKPDIFAKGGDRTPDNMPANEIEVCERLGIEIRYGIGDLLSSSRKRMENAFDAIRAKRKVG